jgi:hypothetical protein
MQRGFSAPKKILYSISLDSGDPVPAKEGNRSHAFSPGKSATASSFDKPSVALRSVSPSTFLRTLRFSKDLLKGSGQIFL